MTIRVISCAISCGLASGLVAAATLAAAADDGRLLRLGAHLASECASCHGTAAASGAIPPLAGKPADEVKAALLAFRSGERSNPVMVSVARSLDDEQIAALAAYFASLRKAAKPK
jgi:cytochrome c553